MAGMRDKLAHEYFGIRLDVVWETIIVRFPQLKLMIEELLIEFDEAMKKE